jgi:hypothetical protein
VILGCILDEGRITGFVEPDRRVRVSVVVIIKIIRAVVDDLRVIIDMGWEAVVH